MKVRKVWSGGLLVSAFLVFLMLSTAYAQPTIDLSIWEGKLFSLVETRMGLDFNGMNVVSSSSVMTKLLYIPGDMIEPTFVIGGPVLQGLLYVREGKEYRLDRFIELQYLGGTSLDFYGNSFASPFVSLAPAGGQVLEFGDQTVFRLKGKMKGRSLSSATFTTVGGIFNEFPFDAELSVNGDNFESIRAGGLAYVGTLLPDLIARPIIKCLRLPPR